MESYLKDVRNVNDLYPLGFETGNTSCVQFNIQLSDHKNEYRVYERQEQIRDICSVYGFNVETHSYVLLDMYLCIEDPSLFPLKGTMLLVLWTQGHPLHMFADPGLRDVRYLHHTNSLQLKDKGFFLYLDAKCRRHLDTDQSDSFDLSHLCLVSTDGESRDIAIFIRFMLPYYADLIRDFDVLHFIDGLQDHALFLSWMQERQDLPVIDVLRLVNILRFLKYHNEPLELGKDIVSKDFNPLDFCLKFSLTLYNMGDIVHSYFDHSVKKSFSNIYPIMHCGLDGCSDQRSAIYFRAKTTGCACYYSLFDFYSCCRSCSKRIPFLKIEKLPPFILVHVGPNESNPTKMPFDGLLEIPNDHPGLGEGHAGYYVCQAFLKKEAGDKGYTQFFRGGSGEELFGPWYMSENGSEPLFLGYTAGCKGRNHVRFDFLDWGRCENGAVMYARLFKSKKPNPFQSQFKFQGSSWFSIMNENEMNISQRKFYEFSLEFSRRRLADLVQNPIPLDKYGITQTDIMSVIESTKDQSRKPDCIQVSPRNSFQKGFNFGFVPMDYWVILCFLAFKENIKPAKFHEFFDAVAYTRSFFPVSKTSAIKIDKFAYVEDPQFIKNVMRIWQFYPGISRFILTICDGKHYFGFIFDFGKIEDNHCVVAQVWDSLPGYESDFKDTVIDLIKKEVKQYLPNYRFIRKPERTDLSQGLNACCISQGLFNIFNSHGDLNTTDYELGESFIHLARLQPSPTMDNFRLSMAVYYVSIVGGLIGI